MRALLLRSIVALALVVAGIPAITADDDGGRVVYQTANFHDFPGMTMPVGGAATLMRTRQAVEARIATSGLEAGAAFTVWWIVFNNPGHCAGGCGPDDLGNAAAGPSAFYAAGFVTDDSGTVNITARVAAGRLPHGIDVLLGRGLKAGNGLGAEIHMIIRSHGPIIPGMVAAQIGSFGGACDVYACHDPQAVGFPAVP